MIIFMEYFDLSDNEVVGSRAPFESFYLSFSATYCIDLHLGFLFLLTDLRMVSGLVTLVAICFDSTLLHAVTWNQTHKAGFMLICLFVFLFKGHLSKLWASPQR